MFNGSLKQRYEIASYVYDFKYW